MGLVSVWLVAVIVIRDAWVTAMRIIALAKGTELATSGDAKLKTGIQLTVVITTIVFTGGRLIAMTLAPEYSGFWVDISNYILFYNGLLSVAVVFTIYSWIKYVVRPKIA
jgi:CDP-diacylglycerol--glycerol-3-phosphate 3-phosphatidyltransferase